MNPTNRLTDPEHPHVATRIGEDAWRVSWIPDQVLTYSQAVTAMSVARLLHQNGTMPEHLVGYLSPLETAAEHLAMPTVSGMLRLYETATAQ